MKQKRRGRLEDNIPDEFVVSERKNRDRRERKRRLDRWGNAKAFENEREERPVECFNDGENPLKQIVL